MRNAKAKAALVACAAYVLWLEAASRLARPLRPFITVSGGKWRAYDGRARRCEIFRAWDWHAVKWALGEIKWARCLGFATTQ